MSTEEKNRNSPRATPSEPIDYVLDQLYDLQTRLDKHTNTGTPGSGMLEKYDYFCRVSDKGRQCTYGVKSKYLFVRDDLPDVQEMVLKLLTFIRQTPGNENFGR